MLRWVASGLVIFVAIWLWQGRIVGETAGVPADMATIAASVQAEEVVIYTTSTCTYCAQAMRWLDQQGFAYTECNMSTTPRCEQEFVRCDGGKTTHNNLAVVCGPCHKDIHKP
nr:glutaredoxin domain-containing protein [uncultured Aquabacterium sp.]